MITCGVPQESLHSSLFLILIYVNNIPNCLDYVVARLFADHTNLTFPSCNLPVVLDKVEG